MTLPWVSVGGAGLWGARVGVGVTSESGVSSSPAVAVGVGVAVAWAPVVASCSSSPPEAAMITTATTAITTAIPRKVRRCARDTTAQSSLCPDVLIRQDDLIVGQPAHAWVSGQLARAWGSVAFPAPEPREPVCLAAEQHDVGWADADRAPLLGPAGRPLSFVEYPRAEHVAIWRGAASRLVAQSRYAALLVSLHGTSLYERIDPERYDPPVADAIREYVRGQRVLQSELAAGLDGEEVDRNRRLLLAWDRLSLALCHGDGTVLEGVPGADGPATIRVEPAPASGGEKAGGIAERDNRAVPAGGIPERDDRAVPADGIPERDDRAVPAGARSAAFTLAPWPFAAARVVVGCEARALPGRFADAAALHAALADAPWVAMRFALQPG